MRYFTTQGGHHLRARIPNTTCGDQKKATVSLPRALTASHIHYRYLSPRNSHQRRRNILMPRVMHRRSFNTCKHTCILPSHSLCIVSRARVSFLRVLIHGLKYTYHNKLVNVFDQMLGCDLQYFKYHISLLYQPS